DISIIDDKFLQTFKHRPHQNLQLKLLEKLLRDEIQFRQRKNLAQARSFRELLEETIRKYHNRLLDAAAVIQEIIKIRKEMESVDQRAKDLNLDSEEIAFYDAVSENYGQIYEMKF